MSAICFNDQGWNKPKKCLNAFKHIIQNLQQVCYNVMVAQCVGVYTVTWIHSYLFYILQFGNSCLNYYCYKYESTDTIVKICRLTNVHIAQLHTQDGRLFYPSSAVYERMAVKKKLNHVGTSPLAGHV